MRQPLTGKPVSPGYASGEAFVLDRRVSVEFPRYRVGSSEVPREHRRFRQALEQSYRELKTVEHRVLAELGEASSAIFAAHLSLLRDESFVEGVRVRVSEELVNVEQALDAEIARLCELLAGVENAFIRQRVQDIRDVGNRVMRNLAATTADGYEELPPRSVIVSRELLPSETIDLDRRHVVAIVTEEGGENSHAAILARALGIPAVSGVARATALIATRTPLLVDGEKGLVTLAPDTVATREFVSRKSRYDDDCLAADAAESLDCATRDGTRIRLLANINRPEEARLVAAHHLDGIGLFRTEFMYLDSPRPPSYERQVAVVREISGALAGRPLTIRALDLGGDKLPTFLETHLPANSNLGMRGLRFALHERRMLVTQLRAVIAASRSDAEARILLPMVLGADDLAEGIDLARRIAAEMGRPAPLIGAMIETPSALFALDEILEAADFVSIGTNDLTQFMLAADRNAVEMAGDYSVLHPSVLRAIHRVVEACRAARREVCICGEAASYPRTSALLVGLGARHLSMSPVRAARVRWALRGVMLAELEELADRALHCGSTEAVRALLQNLETTRPSKPMDEPVSQQKPKSASTRFHLPPRREFE